MNFESNPGLIDIFNGDITPEYLIPIFKNITKETVIPNKTLIIFDEVQLCEKALKEYIANEESLNYLENIDK